MSLLTRSHRISQVYRSITLTRLSFKTFSTVTIPMQATTATTKSDTIIFEKDYGNLALRYHNSVIEAIFSVDLDQITNTSLKSCCVKSREMLQFVQKRMKKLNKNFIGSGTLPMRIQRYRQQAVTVLPSIIDEICNDSDMKTLGGCLAVLLPQSEYMWRDVDKKISLLVDSHIFSISTLIIVAHACLKAKIENGWSANLTMTLTAINKRLESEISFGIEVFPLSMKAQTDNDQITETACARGTEYNASVDQLGLLLEVFAGAVPPLSLPRNRVLLEAVRLHVLNTLQAVTVPVKLSTLRLVWEKAPMIRFPDSYALFKDLYDQVYRSVEADPLQLANQEQAVESLLDGMCKVGFKNSKLIQLISDILERTGYDKSRASLRLFSLLVQHDALNLAFRVLRDAVESDFSSNRVGLLYLGQASTYGITDAARIKAADLLRRDKRVSEGASLLDGRTLSAGSRLLLALMCFGREDWRGRGKERGLALGPGMPLTSFGRVLVAEEEAVLSDLAHVSRNQALDIFYAYGIIGRKHPGVFAGLDAILESHIPTMTAHQCSCLVWSMARTNYRPSYLPQCAVNIVSKFGSVKDLCPSSGRVLIRSLWAMTVLGIMQPGHILQLEPLLDRFVQNGQNLHLHVLRQLNRVWSELRLEASAAAPIAANDTASLAMTQLLAPRRWEKSHSGGTSGRSRSPADQDDPPSSSETHKDASRLLSQLGHAHVNEARLEFDYLVDVLLPQLRSDQYPKGTVIELDGPFHFDTYLYAPLGTTILKRKHLAMMGYCVISLPFWTYHLAMSEQCRKSVLQNAIYSANITSQ